MVDPTAEELAKLYPPRDRRRRKRLLTLRNARWVVLFLIVLFVLISLASEIRYRNSSGDFGRLYARRTRVTEIEPRKPYTVVTETSVAESAGGDPMLLDAARRAQYLGVTPEDLEKMRPQPPQTDTSATVIIPGGERLLGQTPDPNQEKARFEITGGPEGVRVSTETGERRPESANPPR